MIVLQDSRFRTSEWIATGCLLALLVLTCQRPVFAQAQAEIPSVERQKQIAKDLEGGYSLTRLETAAQKQDAIKKLLEASRDQKLSTDERYVVLTTVLSLAKETGDTAGWLHAANALVGTFAVDAQKQKTQLLTEFLTASKSQKQLKLAITEAIDLSQAIAHENQYVEARALLDAAAAAVRRATGADNLRKLVTEASDTVAVREKDWKAFQVASEKLESDADDPVANFTVGRWHVLHEDDWQIALPFLAKGSDAKWKTAAELEAKGAVDGTAQAAIGDAWFEIGEAELGTIKKALLLHAGTWYEEAQPNLTSVLKKQALAKRLSVIASLKATVPQVAGTPPIDPARKPWHGWPVTAPPPAIAPFNAEQAKCRNTETSFHQTTSFDSFAFVCNLTRR